jgi:hypothetical protein
MTRVHSGVKNASIPTELVARLEVAEAPCRDLDAEIGRAFGGQVIARFGDYDWRAEGHGIWRALPMFTRSLDDTLALAGRVLVAPYVGPISLTIAGSGQAYIDHTDPCRIGVQAFGNTPALALCLAVLKATTASAVGTDERSEGVNP